MSINIISTSLHYPTFVSAKCDISQLFEHLFKHAKSTMIRIIFLNCGCRWCRYREQFSICTPLSLVHYNIFPRWKKILNRENYEHFSFSPKTKTCECLQWMCVWVSIPITLKVLQLWTHERNIWKHVSKVKINFLLFDSSLIYAIAISYFPLSQLTISFPTGFFFLSPFFWHFSRLNFVTQFNDFDFALEQEHTLYSAEVKKSDNMKMVCKMQFMPSTVIQFLLILFGLSSFTSTFIFPMYVS